MGSGNVERSENSPGPEERPVYGYDSPAVQETYTSREAERVAGFLLPHLRPGMTLLDCGCGPGAITVGLADAVAPGLVTGVDLEPGMIAKANELAKERGVENVEFRTADITDLPFPDDSFDVVFTSAALEHLAEPERALEMIHSKVKPGGLVAAICTDWGDPLISPVNAELRQFFELFERGFNRQGGSLNRGRHLRVMMRKAVFDVIEFSASFGNSSTPDAARESVDTYIDWMDNLPLFEHSVELGWVDRPTLDGIKESMRQWANEPDAFLALGRCEAIGRKA
jgi:ubiquinone/menaquinone biosynthesis C-methylase UbiE